MTCKFTSVNFWKEEDLGAKEANKRKPEGQDRWAHAARYMGRVGRLIWKLRRFNSSLRSCKDDVRKRSKSVFQCTVSNAVETQYERL